MDYYEYLNEHIRRLVKSPDMEKYEGIVLYPFGKQGVLIKQILNWRYGIEEAFIIDNGLCKVNPKIKSLNYLQNIDTSKYVFVITSDNLQYWDDIRDDLKKYVKDSNIVDMYLGKPLKYGKDSRVASLELAAREIYDKKINGAVAEAGVYQGYFSAYINELFFDRKLYLFDTFEGFENNDIESEKNIRGFFRDYGRFEDTNVETVLAKMPFVNNIEVRKGYFPDTTEGIDEKFAFVSLDMDLYQPIKAGLEYFYPRLECGGYIFVHDCNIGHDNFKGSRKALLEFVEKTGIGYVMLPDNCTAVITR